MGPAVGDPDERPPAPEPALVALVERIRPRVQDIGLLLVERYEYVALWEAGRLPGERLVSAYLDLDDVNQAMDDLATGRAMRQVIKL
jgi:alcohol dehydrogenase